MTIGLIIAKKHSRRLTNKNVLPFCGLPLCEWSIIQSICSRLIEKTYVSTDSEEIAKLGEKHGATIIWRDYDEDPDAGAPVPYMHAIKKIRDMGESITTMVPLLPTNPQRKLEDLDRGLTKWFWLKSKGINLIELPAVAIRHESYVYQIKEGKYGNISRPYYIDKFYNSGIDATIACILDADKWLCWRDTYARKHYINAIVDKNQHTDQLFYPWHRIFPWVQQSYRKWRYFWPVEEWQNPDIDYEDQFYFVEMIMEHFILKGRGPEIYFEYKEKQK